MTRLFVAIDFPEEVITALAQLLPAAGHGIRVVEPELLHLTLHFLGDADQQRVAAALAAVEFRAFHLTLAGVGRFMTADRGAILWAGVTVTPDLLALHTAVADVLRETGFRAESRPYSPHITLARCKPWTDRAVMAEFLERHTDFATGEIRVDSFALYSSKLKHGDRVYCCEQRYCAR